MENVIRVFSNVFQISCSQSTGIVATPTDRDLPGARMGSNSSDIGMEEESQTDMSLGGGSEEVWSPVHPGAGGGRKGGGASGWWEGEDDVPEDPQLAESHYSQFEDFESLSSEEEVSGSGSNEAKYTGKISAVV